MERMIVNEKGNVPSPSGGRDERHVVQELMEMIETVGSYVGFRRMQRKECWNLVRRLKLLVPLLEEIMDIHSSISTHSLNCLSNSKKSLVSAKKLLKNCNDGSKIYLALESEAIFGRFHTVYDKLNNALDHIPYDEMGISIEVKEQVISLSLEESLKLLYGESAAYRSDPHSLVELMRMQLKRAKRRTDIQDIELAMDLMVSLSRTDERSADIAVLERLANKLDLHTVGELKGETLAVRKLGRSRSGQNAESIQQMTYLLGKFKQIAGMDDDINVLVDASLSSTSLKKCLSLSVPHEFLCPITLEIMTDPVIVATGQTYERESIQKWLNSNHRTCPKTGQTLVHLSLAPNYALCNLILQWCDNNNIELPKKDPFVVNDHSDIELKEEISSLVQRLSSSQLDVQRKAITKIRKLSKENPSNRILIANNGGIPPLVKLLSYPLTKIQEQTVTAVLNLSLDETNKRLIARKGAIHAIIGVLQNGTDDARENSAAALFSLLMLDENKEKIGSLNGIPPLVNLLKNGTSRGKKDAATALFNLSLNQANKSRAIKAGIIPPLLHLLEDKNLSMIDEALSILLHLASHPEGLNEIGRFSFIKKLVKIIREWTPKNKECATSVLVELGLNNSSFILAALQYGVYEHLVEITRCGTNRAQRKPNSLLQHMSKCEHIP